MKRTLLIGMLLTSVSAFAFMGHHDSMRMMFNELELSPEQKSQMKTIRKESRDERIKIMDQMESLREKKQERIMAVLDKDQQVKFKAMRKEMMLNRQNNCGERGKMGMRKPNCGR